MRILIVHNRYQHMGGEDAVFEAEVQMLNEQGHEVTAVVVNNDNITSPIHKIGAAISSVYSKQGCALVAGYLERVKPDIMHVHNYFPRLSPYIFKTAHRYGVPTVHTLHNYRAICPSATFLNNGEIDETCLRHSAFRMVPKRVYRGSYLGTAAVAMMIEYHKAFHTWERDVDVFIALTQFSRRKFIQAGFPADKIHIKPNFVDAPKRAELKPHERNGALFVGRMSKEKGVDTLLKAWREIDYPLTLVGGGDMDGLRSIERANVNCLGIVRRDEVYDVMSRARFLVMPSEWYEGFPVTLCEAYAMGLPVVASDIGSLSELVEESITGYKFESGNVAALRDTAMKMINSPLEAEEMSTNARRTYEMHYTKEKNYSQLMNIYEKVIEQYNS